MLMIHWCLFPILKLLHNFAVCPFIVLNNPTMQAFETVEFYEDKNGTCKRVKAKMTTLYNDFVSIKTETQVFLSCISQ